MSADGEGRERADDEVDAAWADIVARLGPLGTDEDAAPQRRESASEDEGRPTGGPTVPPTAPPGPPAGPRDHAPAPRDGDADGAAAAEEDHFVPEDPAPLRGAGLAWWAPWLALVGAPVLLGVVALARGSVPTWLVLAAVVAFAGGAVAAVMRLPSRTDDGGDGAVL